MRDFTRLGVVVNPGVGENMTGAGASGVGKSVGSLRLVTTLGAGILAVSASAILIRLAHAPSLSIAFWRVTLSLCLLLPLWCSGKRWRELVGLTGRQRWQLFASGLCLGVHFWSWISSLAYTSVAASVLLVTTNPLWVGLLSPWVVGEHLSRKTWLGIVIAMGGASYVALSGGGGAQPAPLLGNGLALLGALGASGYLMLGRTVRPHLDLWSYASGTLAGAWGVLFCGMLLTGAPFVGFGWDVWGLFVSMALLPQLVGHNAISWSLRYLKADAVSVLLLLEPIGSALLAWMILRESPPQQVVLGGVFLLAGIFLVLWNPKKEGVG